MGLGFKGRAAIIIPVVLVGCLMPALLLYYLGFRDGSEWNNGSVSTECKITGHQVEDDTCPYTCMCTTGVTHMSLTCQICYYDCYNGYIDTTYNVDNISYTHTFRVISGDDSRNDVVNDLNKNYPIGTHIRCYYQEDDPIDIKRELIKIHIFHIFFILFCVLGGTTLLVWGIVELIIYFYGNALKCECKLNVSNFK